MALSGYRFHRDQTGRCGSGTLGPLVVAESAGVRGVCWYSGHNATLLQFVDKLVVGLYGRGCDHGED